MVKRATSTIQHGLNLVSKFDAAGTSQSSRPQKLLQMQNNYPNIPHMQHHIAPPSFRGNIAFSKTPNSVSDGDSTDDTSGKSDSTNTDDEDSDLDDCEIPVALGNPNNQRIIFFINYTVYLFLSLYLFLSYKLLTSIVDSSLLLTLYFTFIRRIFGYWGTGLGMPTLWCLYMVSGTQGKIKTHNCP